MLRGSPPDDGPVFFVDACLGRRVVAEVLRTSVEVRIHDEHFAVGTDDDVWIPHVSDLGWIILTKDTRIKRRDAHLATLRRHRAAAFILTAKKLNGQDQARAFQAGLRKMKRLYETHDRPLLATISASGHIEILEGARRAGIKRG